MSNERISIISELQSIDLWKISYQSKSLSPAAREGGCALPQAQYKSDQMPN